MSLQDLVGHQQQLWHHISGTHDLSIQDSDIRCSPLKLEINICVKLMLAFLEVGLLNLLQALAENKTHRIATFALLNSIVLDNIAFKNAFQTIYGVSCTVKKQKGIDDPLNPFEQCIVGVVYAIEDLARQVRTLNKRATASVSEAHAHASATLKLAGLLTLRTCNYEKYSNKHRFRDFDTHLCSNVETSVLDSTVSSHSLKERLRPKFLFMLKGTLYSAKVLELSRSIEKLLRAFRNFSAVTLTQSHLWSSAIDSSMFSYGVERYVEKCTQETSKAAELEKGLARVLEILCEVAREIKKYEASSSMPKESPKEYVFQLIQCVAGYMLMAYWWWFQEVIGTDHIKKIHCLRKLDTPTRECFQTSVENNQDIINDYLRDFNSIKKMMEYKL